MFVETSQRRNFCRLRFPDVFLYHRQERSLAPGGRSGQTCFVACLVNNNTPPTPLFFVSVDSRGFTYVVSCLESTLAGWFVSVAFKWVRGMVETAFECSKVWRFKG